MALDGDDFATLAKEYSDDSMEALFAFLEKYLAQ